MIGSPQLKVNRRISVKKTVVILLVAFMVTAAGCQKKEEAAKPAAPQVAAQVAVPPVTAPKIDPQAPPPAALQSSALQTPAGTTPGADPHAGMKLKEMAAGTGHKGKVLQIVDAGSYTYLEVEEKGKKLWIAALKVKVAKGDMVEFPDSKPMENFHSKTLNKTFDKIIFAESVNVRK